jgi:hypothetical protein
MKRKVSQPTKALTSRFLLDMGNDAKNFLFHRTRIKLSCRILVFSSMVAERAHTRGGADDILHCAHAGPIDASRSAADALESPPGMQGVLALFCALSRARAVGTRPREGHRMCAGAGVALLMLPGGAAPAARHNARAETGAALSAYAQSVVASAEQSKSRENRALIEALDSLMVAPACHRRGDPAISRVSCRLQVPYVAIWHRLRNACRPACG